MPVASQNALNLISPHLHNWSDILVESFMRARSPTNAGSISERRSSDSCAPRSTHFQTPQEPT
jgi:hypothetical protein